MKFQITFTHGLSGVEVLDYVADNVADVEQMIADDYPGQQVVIHQVVVID